MKLVTYRPQSSEGTGPPLFGAVCGTDIVCLSEEGSGACHGLGSVEKYLAGLPHSFERAAAIASDPSASVTPLADARLLPALPRPAAILDCGLSPAHLRASSRTLLGRSLPWPLGEPLGWILGRAASRSRSVRFYKGNHHSISGPNEEIVWPDFTSYLDIEPELAMVTGSEPQRHAKRVRPAGYIIYNDVSARDVQLGEMLFTGPASSKDFDTGNGIGPYLVTPDELPRPLDLSVQVEFDTRSAWHGSTSEYSLHPEELLAHILRRRSLPPGTIIGLGTVPGCCGLDRDEWLEAGEGFTIRFDGMGELRQRFGVPANEPQTRWSPRQLVAEAH